MTELHQRYDWRATINIDDYNETDRDYLNITPDQLMRDIRREYPTATSVVLVTSFPASEASSP